MFIFVWEELEISFTLYKLEFFLLLDMDSYYFLKRNVENFGKTI